MATYKLTITSAQGINTGLTCAVALFATPVSGDVEPYSQKVYVLDGSSSVMGVSPVQKNVIILSQILSNTSAIRAVGYTRIGVCLNSDGSVDWDAPVIYHPQMGGWLQCPGILTAYGTKILRGYDKGTYREGHYSIRLPSSSSLSCGYVEIDYILYAPPPSPSTTPPARPPRNTPPPKAPPAQSPPAPPRPSRPPSAAPSPSQRSATPTKNASTA